MTFNLNQTSMKIGLNSIALVAMLTSYFFINPPPAFAVENAEAGLPDLFGFSVSVLNGNASELRGVYVPQVLAMPIVQQPLGNPGFVSSEANTITQFSMAAEVGNIGLLAHNYLGGVSFANLASGQEVNLIYGDGRVETFIIRSILQYQALDPYSPYSEFRDLESGTTFTAEQVFGQVYRGERHVTFQTCIAANGNSSWGRLFVIAEPKPTFVVDDEYLLVHRIR